MKEKKRKRITIRYFLPKMYKRQKHDGVSVPVPVVSAGVRAHWCFMASTCMMEQCSFSTYCTIFILDVRR